MNESSAKPVLGIVGAPGAGKSSVAAEFARLGCAVVDGDAIGHRLLGDADVRDRLRRRWGERIFADDGQVDRQALGAIVFGDPAELAELNRILHPRIRAEIERRIAAARADAKVPAVVVDAAVLFEAGWDDLCTRVIFVGAPRAARLARLQAARGWDSAALAKREKSQISLDTKA